jgi:solute carrier family 25 aspartate/glutamate transporter 12/13
METSIVFHFAGRGISDQRLSILDFAQLLDPRWRHPSEGRQEGVTADISSTASFFQGLFHSMYNFAQGGEY